MDDTMIIKLTNKKAAGLIREMEALHLLQIVQDASVPASSELSKKYRGIITPKQGHDLKAHIRQMRREWNNT